MRTRAAAVVIFSGTLLTVTTPAHAAKAAGPACTTADSPDGWSVGTAGTGPTGDQWWVFGSGLPKAKLVERDVTDPAGVVTSLTGPSSTVGTVGDLEAWASLPGTYTVVLRSAGGGKSSVLATCTYIAR